jgi:hypothetical protein
MAAANSTKPSRNFVIFAFFLESPHDFSECLRRVMISNERPSPYLQRPPTQPWHQPTPRPHVNEDTLKSEQVQVERKTFVFLLKENPRGRFLRIIEEGGRLSNSIIPSAGSREFQKLLDEMLKASSELPPEKQPQ